MDDFLPDLGRSSWGVLLAHANVLLTRATEGALALIVAVALVAWALRASWAPPEDVQDS